MQKKEIDCPFCGGKHEQSESLVGAPVVWCSKLPKGWVAIGPDGVDESFVILKSEKDKKKV